MSAPTGYANRLAQETSPYLLQHAHNPVDWYPWGREALERARRENKPILLSIGYSACHWCHVMAHESFEDPATAEVMNALYVNVKVDREERPDLDKIYQTAHQFLNRRGGGWPLTVFLTPEQRIPFFAGTYFPPAPRYGVPAFRDILKRIAAAYHEQRGEIARQNAAVLEALRELSVTAADVAAEIDSAPLQHAYHQLENSFDEQHGGFGGAPKFPHPPHLEFLLRYSAAQRDKTALTMALRTLRAMAHGGIYDQLGGGFCRYSVDERWEIPHFEKMLYDNALLLPLYAQAWLITREPLYERITAETVQWLMREMQAPEGGFYSALDADSEGHEGKFYVWTQDEVCALLSDEEYAAAAPYFGLDQPDNFEGHWHFCVRQGTSALEQSAADILQRARAKLFQARETRVRPGCDDKILTAWNALMIKGLAIAARILNRPEWLACATRALDFIRAQLWCNGRLLVTYKDGKAHLSAYLDDYAFLLDALLELLQTRWRSADLAFAVEIAEVLLKHFEDPQQGGFYFTADDHEQLIQRPKPLADDATPSGNGVAAYALARLGHLLGEARYLDAAERTLKAAWPSLQQTPYAYNTLLNALEEHLAPPQTIILRGAESEMQRWQRFANEIYAPRRLLMAIPNDASELPGVMAERKPIDAMTAYVCEGLSCSAPLIDFEEFNLRLKPGEVTERSRNLP
ncbi:MAG: thioredoxin domain-containing protein [Gammaproteobacteria bacterium]|nr:thioredoxin domain-containing protein [Gammaproteobacteria bacterium]